jgi:hypothetical protein
MKSFFSFLILLLAFVNLVSNSEVTYPFTLVHISGIFHEKQANQEMTLLTQGEKANPSLFKQLVLKEERTNELYFTRLTCFDKEEIYNYSYVNCTIDLSQIPAGFYKVTLFFYNNQDYKNNNMPPLLIHGDKKEEKEDKGQKLINVFSNITESNYEQLITFELKYKLFSPYSIKWLNIFNNRNEHFRNKLHCQYNTNTNYTCLVDFSKIKADIYVVEYLEVDFRYEDMSNIYPKGKVTIEVHEKPLKLLSINGNAQEGNYSMLNLTFNKNVNKNEFGGFYVFNDTDIFNLTRKEIFQYNDSSSIEVELDFKKVPSAYYHMGVIYKGHDWRFLDSKLYVFEKSKSHFKNFFMNLFSQNKLKTNLRKKK